MDAVDTDDVRASRSGVPVFDTEPLQRIGDQLGDEGAARRFATVYLGQLDARVTRLCGALENGEREPAMDAVLSLKVASASVGTRELERMALSLESMLRGDDLPAARRVGRHLPSAAARGRDALRGYLA